MTSAAFRARTTKQIPVFICAQADNDQPVGMVFPLGNAGHAITEATIGDLEKWCVTHALGFVPSFRTHTLAGPTADKPFVLDPPGINAGKSILGGRRGEGGDRRTRRHLADAVPSVHREHRLPARAGLEERPERRAQPPVAPSQAGGPLGRSRVVREIPRPDQGAAVLRQTRSFTPAAPSPRPTRPWRRSPSRGRSRRRPASRPIGA